MTNTFFRVLIVEPEAAGHHLVYASLLIDAFLSLKWHPVLMTSPLASRSAAFLRLQEHFGNRIEIIVTDEPPSTRSTTTASLLWCQFKFWKYLLDSFRKKIVSVEAVYLINLDTFDKAFSILGSPFGKVPVHGMLMHLKYHHRSMGIDGPGSRSDRIFSIATERLLAQKRLASMFVIDPLYVDFINAARKNNRDKVVLAPDPVVTMPTAEMVSARANLPDIPVNAFVVLIFGALSERKGLACAIEAVENVKCARPVVLMVAGDPDRSARAILESDPAIRLRRSGRLIEILQYVDQQTEQSLYRACDVVWVLYPGFYGMSGVLITGHAFQKPVIGSRSGLIAWYLAKHGSGITLDPNDINSVTVALESLALDPERCIALGKAGQASISENTPSNFVNTIANRIAKVHELPPQSA